MTIDPIAKILIVIGIIFLILGLTWQFGLIQYLRIGRLPGDIYIEKDNFKFYFPLTTGILLSLIVKFLFWIFKS
ncbi:MAG: DUF2905 domain-containing protein [Pseudobdellovibrionaceae bacterium]